MTAIRLILLTAYQPARRKAYLTVHEIRALNNSWTLMDVYPGCIDSVDIESWMTVK
jgi:hypothetical protein